MSSSPDSNTTGSLGTTSARLVAVRFKAANKNIFRALLSLASANLLIRVAGMFNQVVVTARFGQGEAMDAYFVAAALPTLLAQLLASGIEASVIPVYTRVRTREGRKQASRLFSTLLNLLLVSLLLFTIFLLALREQVIFISAPGLSLRSQDLATDLTPFIFPVLILMVMNSFMECLLNSEGQFGWPAYAGMLVPITTATLVFLEGREHGVLMLCIGTLVGQFFQLLVILFRAHRAKLTYMPVIDLRNPHVVTVLRVAWPYIFGALISQASPLVDQIFASTLSTGSIAAINNANKLISVPTGVIFVSVGRAVLPYLSHQAATKDMKSFKETLRLYSWAVGLGTAVISAGMILLAYPIVQILFQRGSFHSGDTIRTATTMIGFAIGLVPMSLGFIMSRAISALGKPKLLMSVTIFSVFANALLDYILAHYWQSFGIALATSGVYCCTLVILIVMLRVNIDKLYLLTPPNELSKVIWRVGLGQYYVRWLAWKEDLVAFAYAFQLQRRLGRGLFIGLVFLAGIIGVALNPNLTLRIAFGSIIVLFLLRYQYYLLVGWVLLAAFIGSTLPFFNGNNFLSGLTLPTVVLLFYLPTKLALQRMRALTFYLAFLIWILLGVGISAIPVSQFFTIWTTDLDYLGVAVITIFVISTRKRLLRLIDLILVSSVIVCLYGVYGYFTKQYGVVDSSTSLFRISSIFGSAPPMLALFLSVTLPLGLYRTFTSQGFRKAIAALICALFLVTMALTFTRGAYISVPIGMLVMMFFLPSRRLKVAILGIFSMIVAIAGLLTATGTLTIFNRFFNQDITTLNGRTLLWQAVLSNFNPAQLLGYGLKGSDVLLTNLHVGVGRGIIATASHNIYLEALYDHGLIGVTLLLLTFITLAVSLLKLTRGASIDRRMMLATALAVFVSVAFQSLESNDIWNQAVGIYFWIVMALPFALYWTRAEQSRVQAEAQSEVVEKTMGEAPERQSERVESRELTPV